MNTLEPDYVELLPSNHKYTNVGRS